MTPPGPAAVPAARVVVGVDGSECSVEALRWAVGEARTSGGTVQVVTAWEPVEDGRSDAAHPADVKEARRALGSFVAGVLGERPGMDVEVDLVRGAPVPVLLEAAQEADVLVLGARGQGGFAGLALGSVGLHCVRHAPCSVVIVH